MAAETSLIWNLRCLDSNRTMLPRYAQPGRANVENIPRSSSRLVANISARTKNVRDGFSDAVEVMLTSAPDAVSAGKHLKKIRNVARKDAIRNLREKYPALSPNLIRQRVALLLKKEMARQEMSKFIRTGAQELVAKFDVPQMTRDAHNRALHNTLSDTERVELLKAFSWTVDLRPEPTWILGDVGCVAKLHNSETLCNVLMGSKEELEAVCLPISDKALLVGRSPQSRFQPDVEQVNRASAELSQDFFLASVVTLRERALQPLLGGRCRLMSEDDLRRIMRT